MMEITPKNAVGLWRREPRGLHQPAEDGARPGRVERAAVKQAVAVGLCLNGVKGAHLEREDGGEERDVFGLLQNGERLVVEGRGVGGGDTLANQWVEDDGLEELREDEGVGGVVEVRDDAELCVRERKSGYEGEKRVEERGRERVVGRGRQTGREEKESVVLVQRNQDGVVGAQEERERAQTLLQQQEFV